MDSRTIEFLLILGPWISPDESGSSGNLGRDPATQVPLLFRVNLPDQRSGRSKKQARQIRPWPFPPQTGGSHADIQGWYPAARGHPMGGLRSSGDPWRPPSCASFQLCRPQNHTGTSSGSPTKHHRNSSHGQMRRQWAPSVGWLVSPRHTRLQLIRSFICMPNKTATGDPSGLIDDAACREGLGKGGMARWRPFKVDEPPFPPPRSSGRDEA